MLKFNMFLGVEQTLNPT